MPPTHLPILETSEQTMLRAWVELAGAVYKLNRRIVATLTQQDVTLPQFDVMATLRFSEGVTQQRLAERLLVTKGNVCGLLDRLERLKWVSAGPIARTPRQSTPSDPRRSAKDRRPPAATRCDRNRRSLGPLSGRPIILAADAAEAQRHRRTRLMQKIAHLV